jgi:hypothetical protein
MSASHPRAQGDPLEPAPWLDEWAQRIAASDGAGLAVFALDTVRPLGFLVSQGALLVEPLLGAAPRAWLRRFGWLMEDSARIEQLLARIEARRARR